MTARINKMDLFSLPPIAFSFEPGGNSISLLILLILLTLGGLGISGLSSLIEAVLLSLNPLWLKTKSSREMPSAKRWLALKQNIERPIAAILIANTMANTGLATVTGAVFLKLFGVDWVWAFSLGLTFGTVVFGELVPKILGVRRSAELAPRLLGPLELAMKVFGPAANAAQYFSDKLSPASGAQKALNDSHIMDIITLTQAAQAEQAIHNREEIIIIHAATLSARRVSRSMIPADSVKVFSAELTLRENLEAMHGFIPRACPVSIDGTLNNVVGYVRLRELLSEQCLASEPIDWKGKIHPILIVSSGDSLTHLLAEFLERRVIAALVQGKDGDNVGWITMDDVTRILMGEDTPSSFKDVA